MIKTVNDFAELDVLVVFMTSGTGVFSSNARKLVGLQQYIPAELTNPNIKVFKDLQEHFGLCRFGTEQIRYADFLKEGVPLICLTVKDLQGPSGQITPIDNRLPRGVGTRQQRGLHSLKSDLDITGNILDLMCFNKSKVIIQN